MARLLVVEDDAANREFFRLVLANAGHDVETAADGREALRAAAARPPDLVLLDIMLPEVNGYEVCQRIKTGEATAHAKVLMLTAKAFSADKRQAGEVGADGFLSKPCDPSELVEEVRRLLTAPLG